MVSVATPPALFDFIREMEEQFEMAKGEEKAYLTLEDGRRCWYETWVEGGGSDEELIARLRAELLERKARSGQARPQLFWRWMPMFEMRARTRCLRARFVICWPEA
jgi:hypothetical protein